MVNYPMPKVIELQAGLSLRAGSRPQRLQEQSYLTPCRFYPTQDGGVGH